MVQRIPLMPPAGGPWCEPGHPGLPRLHGFMLTDEGVIQAVTEWAPGGSLSSKLRLLLPTAATVGWGRDVCWPAALRLCAGYGAELLRSDRAQPLVTTSTIARAPLTQPAQRRRWAARTGEVLAGALAHVHSCGLVHMDVKPDNIMVRGPLTSGRNGALAAGRAGGPGMMTTLPQPLEPLAALDVFIADFGVACGVPEGGELPVVRMGSPAFMAPELLSFDNRLGYFTNKVKPKGG